jgi:putative oxidoreductase
MQAMSNKGEAPLLLIGRILIVLLFFFSGLGKIMMPQMFIQAISKVGLPFPYFCYLGAIFIELVLALAFLLGYRTKLSALAIAGYCVLTALLYHLNLSSAENTIQLLKNFSIAGGLLHYVGSGGGRLSIDAWLASKKGSTAPSA